MLNTNNTTKNLVFCIQIQKTDKKGGLGLRSGLAVVLILSLGFI